MIAYLILLAVIVIGLLMFMVAANPKLQKVGEISFACGLLVALFRVIGDPLLK